jgi:hypothetical protein
MEGSIDGLIYFSILTRRSRAVYSVVVVSLSWVTTQRIIEKSGIEDSLDTVDDVKTEIEKRTAQKTHILTSYYYSPLNAYSEDATKPIF